MLFSNIISNSEIFFHKPNRTVEMFNIFIRYLYFSLSMSKILKDDKMILKDER